jgi:hypothetical protein
MVSSLSTISWCNSAKARTALGHQGHDRSLLSQRRNIFADVEFGIQVRSCGASASNGRNYS